MTYKQLGYLLVTGLLVWCWYMFCTNPNLHIACGEGKNSGMTDMQSTELSFLVFFSIPWVAICAFSLVMWNGWDEPIIKPKKKRYKL